MANYQRMIAGWGVYQANAAVASQRLIPGGPMVSQRADAPAPTPAPASLAPQWRLLAMRRATR